MALPHTEGPPVMRRGKADMRKLSTLCGYVLLALVSPSAGWAQDVPVWSYHYVAAGPTRVLSNWTCWFGATCTYAECHMRTEQAPRLGRLRPVVARTTIGTPGACYGRPITGLSLIYTPRPGAHGTDAIVLHSKSDNGLEHRLVIEVDVP